MPHHNPTPRGLNAVRSTEEPDVEDDRPAWAAADTDPCDGDPLAGDPLDDGR